MARNKTTPSVNENWVKTSDLKHMKGDAKKVLERTKAIRAQYEEIFIPHPTQPRAMICKLIKK